MLSGFHASAGRFCRSSTPRSLPDDKEPFVRVGSLEMKGAHAEAGAQTANLGEIAIGDSK
jgi:hypothetical protein